jgi:Skp family chaperone for outer membrane proteins
MMHSITALILTAALSTSSPAAQATPQADRDMKEIASYRLSMDTVKKVDVAMRAMFDEMAKDPRFQASIKLEAELKALNEKEERTEAEDRRIEELEREKEKIDSENPFDLGSANTLSEMEAQVQKVPPMANALRSAGLTPREYSKFMLAMLQAGMAAGMKKSGLIKELPKDFPAENVQFMLDHEAELTAMQKRWQELGKPKGH